jgi:hypothetical protein
MRAFHPRREHPALYGVSAERISKWCGCHLTTARRWRRGEEPPKSALILIELMNTGDLGLIDPAWSGWLLRGKNLIAPHGEVFSRGDVLSLRFLAQQVAHLMSEARLPRQSDWINGRWEVAQEHAAVSA